MRFKTFFQKTLAVSAGAAVTFGMYSLGGPALAYGVRSAVQIAGPYVFNQGFFGSISTFAIAEHAGFHAMKNILTYSVVAGTTTTAAINKYFTKEEQQEEQQPTLN